METFARIQDPCRMRGFVNSKPFVSEQRYEEAMRSLNDDLRNQFIHYRPISWSVEDLYVYEQCKPVIEIARFLICDSGMCMFSEEEMGRLMGVLDDIDNFIDTKF